MAAVTVTKEGVFKHDDYLTKTKLNKLPPKVKEIILKEREKTNN